MNNLLCHCTIERHVWPCSEGYMFVLLFNSKYCCFVASFPFDSILRKPQIGEGTRVGEGNGMKGEGRLG